MAHSHSGILHSQENHTTQVHRTDSGLSEATQTHRQVHTLRDSIYATFQNGGVAWEGV